MHYCSSTALSIAKSTEQFESMYVKDIAKTVSEACMHYTYMKKIKMLAEASKSGDLKVGHSVHGVLFVRGPEISVGKLETVPIILINVP